MTPKASRSAAHTKIRCHLDLGWSLVDNRWCSDSMGEAGDLVSIRSCCIRRYSFLACQSSVILQNSAHGQRKMIAPKTRLAKNQGLRMLAPESYREWQRGKHMLISELCLRFETQLPARHISYSGRERFLDHPTGIRNSTRRIVCRVSCGVRKAFLLAFPLATLFRWRACQAGRSTVIAINSLSRPMAIRF
jgi:hypothetical protein